MKKKHLHSFWAAFRIVSPWYFLALFLISATVAVFALRSNNQTMISLRNAVYQADKQNGNVEGSLQTLRSYVYSHMNTNLASGPNAVYPPIQLTYTYQRLEQAEEQQATATNSSVYTDAQNYCQQLNPVSFSGRTRVPCIESYVEEHGYQVKPVSPALYEFDFISPSWSPDLAGWSLVSTIVLLILFALSLGARRLAGLAA